MALKYCKHGAHDKEVGCPQCIEERETIHVEAYHESLNMAEGIDPNAWRTGEEEQRPETETPLASFMGKMPEAQELIELAEETALDLRPGEDLEVRGYFEEALKLLDFAKNRTITTTEDIKLATDDLGFISKIKKAMDTKRKALLDPLKADMDAIRETYTYLMAPVLEANEITRSQMSSYDVEQRRIRAEQEEINRLKMEAAQKEMKLKGELSESVNLVEVTPEAPKQVVGATASSGMTDHWVYEILDPLLIPREYLVVDSVMLNSIAKRHHDQKPIPGIRFYNKPFVSVR